MFRSPTSHTRVSQILSPAMVDHYFMPVAFQAGLAWRSRPVWELQSRSVPATVSKLRPPLVRPVGGSSDGASLLSMKTIDAVTLGRTPVIQLRQHDPRLARAAGRSVMTVTDRGLFRGPRPVLDVHDKRCDGRYCGRLRLVNCRKQALGLIILVRLTWSLLRPATNLRHSLDLNPKMVGNRRRCTVVRHRC